MRCSMIVITNKLIRVGVRKRQQARGDPAIFAVLFLGALQRDEIDRGFSRHEVP